ncbi:hypothetical protein, partial [Staphylococcus aureus]|uniref:hypothetical protein n=1 Tax=Staphylococcus aureus TaxID=1280 RepID=UPI001C2DFCA8
MCDAERCSWVRLVAASGVLACASDTEIGVEDSINNRSTLVRRYCSVTASPVLDSGLRNEHADGAQFIRHAVL